jgi:hypothetical protein
MDAQIDEEQSWLDRVRESADWEILEFRAESFQRLFAPPRREESDSAIQTASGSGPSGKPESQEKEAGEGGRMGLNNPERWEC